MGLAQFGVYQLSTMTFWARKFFAGGDCPMHCRMFSSNGGFSLLPSPQRPALKPSPDIARRPSGLKSLD